jgi:hypothetical protein
MRKQNEFERELAVLKALQGVPGVVICRGCNMDTMIIMMPRV